MAKVGHGYLKLQKKYGWERRFAKSTDDLMLYDFDVEAGRHIALATAIPSTLETANDDRIKVLAQLRKSAPYKVELLDKSGKSLGALHSIDFKANAGNYETFVWDGKNPKTGKKDHGTYTLKFTLGDEVRTWPVQVIEGKKKAKADVYVIKKGEEITEDFEGGKLDSKIWKLSKDAKIVDGKGVDGSKAVVLSPGNSMKLLFGDKDDLKVKISMQIYDDGVKKGKKGPSGGYWGTIQSTGNIFAFHRIWRGYLSGDKNYAWLNNGENQWFTPHPNNITRKKGWRTLVFDYTGDKTKITCDGQALEERHMKPAKFIPNGATGLTVNGPGHKMQPLYVDNITVTYP